MTFDPQKHHRRSIRLQGYDYSQPGAYFITLVTREREVLFGEIAGGELRLSEIGRIAEQHWRAIPEHFPQVELGAYVIMPNHIHGIIIIRPDSVGVGASQWDAPTSDVDDPTNDAPADKKLGPQRGSIGAITGAYKMSVSRRFKRELNVIPLWQRNYYEHIIRGEEEYRRIDAYITANIDNWMHDSENPGRLK